MWFRRNDGQMFEAEEGSASHKMMSASGEFEEAAEDEIPAKASDESTTQTNESTLENAGTPPNSGHRSAGKRGGAGKRNQADNS